jgi:hypothetical protein
MVLFMGNPFNRLALFLSQIIFSIITPPLLIPGIVKKSHGTDSVLRILSMRWITGGWE